MINKIQRNYYIIQSCIYLLTLLTPIFLSTSNCFPTTLDDIKDYIDSKLPSLLKKYSVYGSVGTIVLEDNIITFASGYTDKSKLQPMSPTTTSVPVASLSKLFTTIGILQLIEQGKVSFDTDINLYLSDVYIHSPFAKPITIHNLLTHTAGFDDKFLGMGAPTIEKVLPLRKYLSQNLPQIVYPPGYTISYSNHGFALLGHIIETTSKLNFNEYVSKHILAPLEMKNSTFDGTIPPGTICPKGYYHVLNTEKEAYHDFAQTPPASSLYTTAEDFSHFLIMLLNDGKYHNKQILKPKTIKIMFTPRYRFNPALPGYACAWEENYIEGKRILQHTGLTWGFSSLCITIPEEKFGIFISINSDKNNLIWELANDITRKFTLHKHLSTRIRPDILNTPPEIYQQLTGFYRFNRYCRSDIFRLATLFPSVIHEVYIKGNYEEKRIYIFPLEFGAKPWHIDEIGHLLWGKISPKNLSNPKPIMTISKSLTPPTWQVIFGNNAYEPISFYDSKPFKYALLFASISVFLLNTIRALLNLFIKILKREYSPNLKMTDFLSFAFLIYLILFVFYLFFVIEPQTLGYGIPLGLFILILSSFILLIITLIATPKFLISPYPHFPEHINSLLTILACYAILYLMYNTNILDFKLGFLKSLKLYYF